MTRLLAFAVMLALFGAASSIKTDDKVGDPFGDPWDEDFGGNDYQRYCGSITCPFGYISVDNADYVKCKTCSKNQCCDELCMHYLCPVGYIADSEEFSKKCKDSKCTTEQCCNKKYSWTCSSLTCPSGYILKGNASSLKCPNRSCTTERCCDKNPQLFED